MTLDIQYETEIKLPVDYEPLIKKVVDAALDYAACPYELRV